MKTIMSHLYKRKSPEMVIHINGFVNEQEQKEVCDEIRMLLHKLRRKNFQGHKIEYKIKSVEHKSKLT